MKQSIVRVAVLCLMATFLSAGLAQAKDQWKSVAKLTAGGDAKEVQVDMEASKCLIRCETAPVTINTVWVRSGGEKTQFKVATTLAKDGKATVDFGKTIKVTGLRISSPGTGTYEVYLAK
jgi:NADH:ubiquinone oxidoreductase subunit E